MREDFPDPETPVTDVKQPSGSFTSMLLRLLCSAPLIVSHFFEGFCLFSGTFIENELRGGFWYDSSGNSEGFIIGDVDSEKDSIYIVDSKKRGHIVNLGEGKRYNKGGGVDGEITLYKVVGYIKASDFDDKKNGFVIADDYITKRQAEDTMYEWKRKKTYSRQAFQKKT